MKHTTMLFSILALAACGGSKPPPLKAQVIPVEPDPPPVVEAKPEPAPPAPEPAPPPPPKTWHAQAELVPIKGIKIKAATVTFTQEEGQPAAVGSSGWFDGIKTGKYHLVVHEGTDCGASAVKAGKPMGTASIPFAALKGTTSLEVNQAAAIQLDGDAAVIGHTLVLHDDRKGKAGRALACGPIRMGE